MKKGARKEVGEIRVRKKPLSSVSSLLTLTQPPEKGKKEEK